jgi:ferredoxin-NADP reductase
MAEFIQPATVLSSTNLTPHVRQLVVLPKEQSIVFKAGQWVSLKLPVGIKPPLNRAYSKPGDELILSGPYGNFLLPPQIDRELLFVTRYTGLVPIRCMLKHLYAERYRGPVLLIAIAPEEQELLFHQELLTLAVTHPGFRYLPLVAAGGEQQAVDLTLPMLRPLLQASPQVLPMLCGTKAFVKPLRAHFLEAGYDRKEVKTETYD